MKSRYLRLVGLVGLVAIAAMSIASTCRGPQPIDLDIEDHGRFTPSGRAAVEIFPGNNERRRGSLLDIMSGDAPVQGTEHDAYGGSSVEGTLAVVGEIAVVEGHGVEPVPAGRRVQFDEPLNGPANATIDVDNIRGHVGVRGGVRFSDVVSLEAIMGLGIDNTRIRVSDVGFLQTGERTLPAPLVGARVSLRPIPLFDLYGQATFMFGKMFTTDVEAGGQLNLSRNVGLYGGYRRWSYREESLKGSGSDADFVFDGPTAGLNITF